MRRYHDEEWGVPTLLLAAIVLGVLFLAGCSGSAGPTCGTGACTRVLFLGNSFTYVNDLPSTFAQLAESAGRPVQVAMVAGGGETLAQHAASSDSLDKIASQGWTYVVLQEQSADTHHGQRAGRLHVPCRQRARRAEPRRPGRCRCSS